MVDLPVVETTFTYVVLGSVPASGFTLAVEPARLEVNPGEVATYQVRISPVGDFFNRVHLEVVGWPAQYPAPSFPVNDVRPRADRTVSMILPAGHPAGEYPIRLRGTALSEV